LSAVLGELIKARGTAEPKLAYAVKSITGTGSFSASDFGLKSIIAPVAAVVVNDPTTLPSQVAQISSYSSTSVSVVVFDLTSTGCAVSTTARNVLVVVAGY